MEDARDRIQAIQSEMVSHVTLQKISQNVQSESKKGSNYLENPQFSGYMDKNLV